MRQQMCTFCGEPIRGDAELGVTTGRPYCNEKHIGECFKAYGAKAGRLDVRDWKATLVEVR